MTSPAIDADRSTKRSGVSCGVLVVGTGSIGSRHARLAAEAGNKVVTVSRRGAGDFADVKSAMAHGPYSLVIVATETSHHQADLAAVMEAGHAGRILVEKPLFDRLEDTAVPPDVVVGYNLRWHPAVQALRDRIHAAEPTIVTMNVGQDLRQWRPGREHTLTASASAGSGGVLRDLSHELDACTWLFGAWNGVAARTAVDPALGIGAETRAGLLIETDRGVLATVSLDYFAAPAVRTWTVSTPGRTLTLDLIRGELIEGSERQCWPADRDLTYRRQLATVLEEPDHPDLCSAAQGADVVALISAAERSMEYQQWIRR